MEFSTTRLVGTKRNDNFYSLYFSSFSVLFWLEMNHNGISFIFWIFFTIFMEFSITCWAGTKRNETIIFIFYISNPFPTYFGLKWTIMVLLLFFELFYYFYGIFYYALGRNETERKYLFSFFLNLFQPILALNEAILAFFNFLNFFGILNYASGSDGTKL